MHKMILGHFVLRSSTKSHAMPWDPGSNFYQDTGKFLTPHTDDLYNYLFCYLQCSLANNSWITWLRLETWSTVPFSYVCLSAQLGGKGKGGKGMSVATMEVIGRFSCWVKKKYCIVILSWTVFFQICKKQCTIQYFPGNPDHPSLPDWFVSYKILKPPHMNSQWRAYSWLYLDRVPESVE